jgi:predicted DNA-binding transcriptional regulator YafY
MPGKSNALIRYQFLDGLFSDYNNKYNFETIFKMVNEHLEDDGVSERQLKNDFKAIRKMLRKGIHLDVIPYQGKKCYYRYSEPNYSLYKSQFSKEDVMLISSTIETLRRYRGLPNFEWVEEVISNLEFRFGIKSNSENVVSFDQNERLVGLNHLSKVIDATVNHTPLFIFYKTFKGKEVRSTLHPYHVKQYNNRWFLFGYEEESGKIANKALDRIQLILPADITFKPNKDIDFAHFFDDIIGVTIPNEDVKKETIVLRFSEERFPYVVSKPVHRTQDTLNEKDCTITLDLKPNRELEQQILSFGPDVEVLSPESFRNQIAKKIKENFKKYFSVQNDCTDNV